MFSLDRKGILRNIASESFGFLPPLTNEQIDDMYKHPGWAILRRAAAQQYLVADQAIRNPGTTREQALYLAGRQDALEFLVCSKVALRKLNDKNAQQLASKPEKAQDIAHALKNLMVLLDLEPDDLSEKE